MTTFKRKLIVFVATSFYYSGLVGLMRWRIQRSGQHLVILNYHRASGGDLRRHMLYLSRHYRVLGLEEALAELNAECKCGKQVRDRRSLLVLTFDDGYRDNYTHAFVLACELKVPITIFLIPGYIESGNCFWWLEVYRLVRHAQVNEATIEKVTYHLDQQEEREALTLAIDTRVRYASSVAEREAFLISTCEALATSSSMTDEEKLALPLTWAEVHEMEESGWVSFGAHTMHHPALAYLADPVETKFEVRECRSVLERELGHPVRTFAYPHGRPEHIGQEGLRAVQDAGYRCAVTTIPGINTRETDPYQLLRVESEVDRHWLVMAAEVTGLWQSFKAGYRKLRRRK